jgi:Zn-dependent protease/CBS domain-containing protein
MELGGFRIATIRGIPIRVHFTFLFALPFLAFGFARAFRSAASLADVPLEGLTGSPWLWGLGVALALFASVLVHELAHAFYARAKGGEVKGITLLLIGGVAQISQPPRSQRDEAVMALVGPLVSLALGALFTLGHTLASRLSFNVSFGLFYLGSLNLFLGAFNLLPAFPMDGGRVLRSLLAGRVGIVRATHIASRVGKVFAVLFAMWGFLNFNMLLLLIAFFVFVGADGETRAVTAKAMLEGLRVRDVMNRQTLSVAADVSVRDAGERMLRERVLALSVTSADLPIGLLTLDAVQAVPPALRGETSARDVAVATPPVSPNDDASAALRLMTEGDLPQLPVAEGSQLVGSVTRDDVLRGLKLSQLEATQRDDARWPAPPRPHGAHRIF